MAIITRALGRTGANVTILGYGAMELRGQPRGPEIADEDAGRLLNAVLDGGINLIDTSPDYGRSEELIGRYLGHRRDEYFLASKCGCPVNPPADTPPPYPHDYSPANVRADVEQSLRRLGTDRLDLVQVHMSPSQATLEENRTIETLRELRDEGKVRFIGMSGILPHIEDHLAMNVFDAFQIPYSAVQRDHESVISRGERRRRGHAHPGRRRARRGVGGEELAQRPAHPAGRRRPAQLGDFRHRGPAGRVRPRQAGVHPALHPQPPGPVHHDRRHRQPGPPGQQHRHRRAGPPPGRPVRSGQEAPPRPRGQVDPLSPSSTPAP